MAYTNICGKKLQSKLGGTLNESATLHSPALLPSSQSFAKRQLEKMGWTEGSGLGKRHEGIVKHVTIKQRQDEMGLGREQEKTREMTNLWWKESVGGTLARLQQQQQLKLRKKETKEKNKSKDKKKKKDKKIAATDDDDNDDNDDKKPTIKTYTDEELFIATGGARFGMRAQRRAIGKWKRTESGTQLTVLETLAKSNIEWNGRGSTTTTTTTALMTMTEKERNGETITGTNKKRKRNSLDDKDLDDKCTTTNKNTSHISPISEEELGCVKAGANSDNDERRRLKKEKKKRKHDASTTVISCTANDNLIEVDGDSNDKHTKKNKKDKKKKNK